MTSSFTSLRHFVLCKKSTCKVTADHFLGLRLVARKEERCFLMGHLVHKHAKEGERERTSSTNIPLKLP